MKTRTFDIVRPARRLRIALAEQSRTDDGGNLKLSNLHFVNATAADGHKNWVIVHCNQMLRVGRGRRVQFLIVLRIVLSRDGAFDIEYAIRTLGFVCLICRVHTRLLFRSDFGIKLYHGSARHTTHLLIQIESESTIPAIQPS